MKIEFMRAYVPDNETLRCEGNEGCGALLMSGDTEKHLKWHAKVEETLQHARSVHLMNTRDVW